MDDDEKSDVPSYAPGYAASIRDNACAPRPREHVWTLVKAGRRMDSSPLFHGESYGWETQLLEGGDLVYGRRFR